MAASAAWSISLTKSLGPLAVTVRRSRSRAPRLITLPARRAALMAVVSMGCMEGARAVRGKDAGASCAVRYSNRFPSPADAAMADTDPAQPFAGAAALARIRVVLS